jgi:Na+/H+ antiporter NhaC
MAVIVVPVYYLSKPGQEAPYDWFPYAALAIVIVAIIIGYILNRVRPGLGERVGSIVADE